MANFRFGKFEISPSEIFYQSEYSVGLVNLKPITPGRMEYILVVPKRVVPRYSDLSINEVIDLAESARHISKVLEEEFTEMKEGTIWLIQDGKDAGQTIPHVHLHIIPKRFSEWYGDSIEDVDRVSRTANDMKEEAKHLKIKFDT